MLTIWQLTDGKRGHENQTLGLSEALCRLADCRVETIMATGGWFWVVNWLLGNFSPGKSLPKPDLILGAGHATHWPMLAARRAYGGRIAVLMKPSLPLSLFDWVIAPAHDSLPAGKGHISTLGPINRIKATNDKDPNLGLFLIGGPSTEYGWHDPALTKQIHLIALHHADIHWKLTTSRRTPAGFLNGLRQLALPNLELFEQDSVGPDWLPAQLSRAAQVWVSPDSASMVYEALTSGAATGALELPFAKPGRVAGGLEKLVREKRLTTFSGWQEAGKLAHNATPLNEAERCAKALLACLTTN